MTDGTVEEKVDKNVGVEGSNPHRDCRFVRFLERQKPTILTFKYRQKPIKTTKKCKGFDRFWRGKTDENRQFLCLNPTKISTQEFVEIYRLKH